MAWIIPLNSYLVSGLVMLFFNFAAIKLFKRLTRSICASSNLRVVYDQRLPLRPHRSRYAFFGGPTGPPPLANLLAFLVTAFAVLVIALDFSVNGETRAVDTPTRFASVVSVLSPPRPLDIDYAREFALVTPPPLTPGGEQQEPVLHVSRRLVALNLFFSCQVLTATRHVNLACAYRDVVLDAAPLVPIHRFLYGGECVSEKNFTAAKALFNFTQTAWPIFNCSLSKSKFAIGAADPGTPIRAATLDVSPPTVCNLRIRETRCFEHRGHNHCAVVADAPAGTLTPGTMVLHMANASAPNSYEHVWVPNVTLSRAGDAAGLAANVAFLRGLNFPHGLYNSVHMALLHVARNVTLVRRERRNVSEINAWLAGPVLGVLAVVTGTLGIVSAALWYTVVRQKGRAGYVTFTSVDEVLAMVREDGLSKSKEGDRKDQAIFIVDGRPVVMPEHCFDRMKAAAAAPKWIEEQAEPAARPTSYTHSYVIESNDESEFENV